MIEDHADVDRPTWYVLFVRCNQEKKVAEALRSREVEYFLPCYKSLRQWKDRRVMLEIPLFPGYVFLHLRPADRARVVTVPNASGLVGTRNEPSAISEEEIAWIRRGLEHGRVAPHPYLTLGQRVMVAEGVMCGMEGILVHKRNNARVVVSLDSIARSFAVEMDVSCLKPVGARNGDAAAREYGSQEYIPGPGLTCVLHVGKGLVLSEANAGYSGGKLRFHFWEER